MRNLSVRKKFDLGGIVRLLLMLSFLACQPIVHGQVNQELIPIEFALRGGATIEINSIQREGKVYIPLQRLFDYLKIKNTYEPGSGRITGFVVSKDTTYEIRTREATAKVGDRSERLSFDDFTEFQGDFYFVPEFYQRMFLLPIEYRPRRVAAVMGARRDLPFFLDSRMLRLEQRLQQKEEELEPEYVFPRQYPLFDGFRLDWGLSQVISPDLVPRRNFSGRTGLFVLGGDLLSRFNVRLSPNLSLLESRHLWRYVPPDEKLFKQILVGDYVMTGLLSREEYGIRITSLPPYDRLIFGRETITGRAFPGRKTYLFSGSVLSSVADSASDGSYSFEAPLRYGGNLMEVRSYDTWGELYRDPYRFLVPNTLVPPGVVDYDISVGRMRDSYDPWHGSFSLFVGASSHVTVGSRVEYFDYQRLERKVVPSLLSSLRFTPHIVGDLVYTPDVLGRATMTAEFPWLLNLDGSYTIYKDVQLFNPRNSLYEWNVGGSYPILFNSTSVGITANYAQVASKRSRERLLNVRLESTIGFFSPSIVHFVASSHSFETQVTRTIVRESDIGARFRLPRNLFVRLGAVYNHLENEVNVFNFNAAISPIQDLSIDFQYERRFDLESSSGRLQVRYYFPFATAQLTATSSRGGVMTYGQAVRGFVGYVPEASEFIYDYRPRASFGGFFVRPFLDKNNNGTRDAGEQELRTSAPKSSIGEEGFTANTRRKEGLGWGNFNVAPYRRYAFKFPQRDLDDPLWKPLYETFGLTAEPGRYRVFDIPIIVGGSVAGSVFYQSKDADSASESVSGVIVRLSQISADGSSVIKPFERVVQTFSTGGFEFVGVPPGDYIISIDVAQLGRSSYRAFEPQKRVTIRVTEQGDQVERVDFVVTTIEQ